MRFPCAPPADHRHRNMGKSHFLDLSDSTGECRSIFMRKRSGQSGRVFDQLDIGDWIGVEGETFTTKTGEPTIKAKSFTVLSKSLRPLPDKWHGSRTPKSNTASGIST